MKSLAYWLICLALAMMFVSSASAVEVLSTSRYRVHEYHQSSFEASLENPIQTADPGKKQVVYSVYLDDAPLSPGEILVALGEIHVQQLNFGPNGEVAIGSCIYVGSHSYFEWEPYNTEVQDPRELTERNGENTRLGVGLAEQTQIKVATWRVPADITPLERYVNIYARVENDNDQNPSKAQFVSGGGQLTVLRFTPVDQGGIPSMDHGVDLFVKSDTHRKHCKVNPASASDPDANIIHRLQLNPTELQPGDFVIALAEREFWYTGSNTQNSTNVRVTSQLVLRDSAWVSIPSTTPTLPITKPNNVSMKGGYRSKHTIVKAAAFQVPAASSGAYWKYLDLVAWSPDLTVMIDDESTLGQDDNPVAPGDNNSTDRTGGKVTLLRFRQATGDAVPVAITQYDQPEYNAHQGNTPYEAMEQICTIPSFSIGANPTDACSTPLPIPTTASTAFTQFPIPFLTTSTETVLALAEGEATNADSGTLKLLGSKLVATNTSTGAEYDLGLNTAVQVAQNSTHHVISPKVACMTLPAGIDRIRRRFWSDLGLNGNCPDAGCQVINCSVVCDGQSLGGCDVLYRGRGRLSMLRFSTRHWCFGDCFPHPDSTHPNNAPDGQVNIDDLVTVITAWGQSGPGIWGDTTDNHIVDIDDLVTVITQWGACPNIFTGTGGGGAFVPQSVNDCFNNCSGSADWQNCMQKCLESLCVRGITEGCQ